MLQLLALLFALFGAGAPANTPPVCTPTPPSGVTTPNPCNSVQPNDVGGQPGG